MTKFEIGKTYSMRSICDHNCVWTYEVIARTEKTVTLKDGDKIKKCRINMLYSQWNNAETVFPLGVYSMSPVLTA